MEETLIILKPDCIEKRFVGEVISRFEKEGFDLVQTKITQLKPTVLREHYAHIADKPFFSEIETFMSRCPVILLVLRGNHAISRIREILGPTNSAEAAPGTIRGDLGTDMMRNVVHASDSPKAASIEKKRFFPEL